MVDVEGGASPLGEGGFAFEDNDKVKQMEHQAPLTLGGTGALLVLVLLFSVLVVREEGSTRFEALHSETLALDAFNSSAELFKIQVTSMGNSIQALDALAQSIQQKRREAEGARRRQQELDAASKQKKAKNAGGGKKEEFVPKTEIQRALIITLSGLMDDIRAEGKAAAQLLREKYDALPTPPPRFNPSDIKMDQSKLAMYDNEYPAEPVDSNPGPAYVPPPDPWGSLSAEEQNLHRRQAVVDAFLHSWNGYVTYAWGRDELQPRSRTAKNWNEDSTKGMGLTILDSLTTMFLMNLTKPLEKALDWVKNELTFSLEVEASVFESTIRCLGSLLSIFELTGERDDQRYLVKKATDLADRLLYAFNTSSGLPHSTVNLRTKNHFNQQWAGGGNILSEFGTMQLEFRTLSYHTKNPIYDMKATHSMAIILSRAPRDMLCPTYMSSKHLTWMTDHISLGALGDSFYEYLLKQYLLTGKTEDRYKNAYLTAAHAIMDKLVFYSKPSHWAYVAEYRRREFYPKMDHLACFVAGMLAFGANQVDHERKTETMKIAAELTKTCVLMYTRQQSGVSPEYVEFVGGMDFINGPGYYILRPEALEAVFYMWRMTHQQEWRDAGWKMFAAIDRWCKNDVGYCGLKEVNVKSPLKDNLQQSFWMAETLKYAYLLFSDDSVLNFSEWVLNTEGHPLKIRNRDPMDLWRSYEKDHRGKAAWYPPKVPGIDLIETEGMKEWRAKGNVRPAPTDPLGIEVEDGAIDDEGAPFDPVEGMRGIERPDTAGAHPREGQGQPVVMRLTPAQRPAADGDSVAVEETPTPRPTHRNYRNPRRDPEPSPHVEQPSLGVAENHPLNPPPVKEADRLKAIEAERNRRKAEGVEESED
jgi:mannosyl-oligosaccharide alpha-1,2-mannosidase